MNPPSRPQALLQAALQRIKLAAREAAERCVDSLGIAALSSTSLRQRDDALAAQFELNRRMTAFAVSFNEKLDSRVARELDPRSDGSRSFEQTDFASLALVDDHEVEAQVSADRFGLAIQHACEWELRELDAYIGSLLRLGRPDHERNPLRPELIGKSLIVAVDAVSERPEVRKALAGELSRSLASTMPAVYRDIVADLRAAGIKPVSLALRTVEGPGNELGRNTSGYESSTRGDSTLGDGGSVRDWAGSTQQGGSSRGGAMLGDTTAGRSTLAGSSGGGASAFGSTRGGAMADGAPIGQVDAQLMALIRRLAFLGNVGQDSTLGGGGAGASGAGALGSVPMDPGGGGATMPMLPNLIYAHRDELRQASTGRLDHMVIDVVGSLFEQILADPKVPPQMARQIARLQLPVLRVALGDVTFFSSRRHPVRRFVNRIASLACAFDDLSAGPGLHFLGLVRDLVQEIVAGDFDQMELYERELGRLEEFIAEQAAQEVRQDAGDAAGLLERKENELLQQQRYMQQLQTALHAVAMQDFLREFLSQVWSQAIVQAVQREGEKGEMTARFKRAGRELVMSVQPKATPAERKNFLIHLPQLMKDLNEGLALIGWPEPAKKAFFAELLLAHAESLKGQQPMRQLDYNMLVKQLDAILAAPLPKDGGGSRNTLPVLQDVVDERRFSAEEARSIGLVSEAAVNWAGTVDIDLGAEPELTEVDINIDGLPPPEPTEPTRGASLADHVQIGFAYQMHLENEWQKVRLTHVSPGRAFFVFTSGRKIRKTISMTARMLRRMCETGRMRAFENAYLIERATARARKQLAALKPAAKTTRH